MPIGAGALLICSVHLNRNKRKQKELMEPSFSSSLLTMPPVFLTAKHANHGPAPPHDLLCSSLSPPSLQLLHHEEEGRIQQMPPLPTTSSAPHDLLCSPSPPGSSCCITKRALGSRSWGGTRTLTGGHAHREAQTGAEKHETRREVVEETPSQASVKSESQCVWQRLQIRRAPYIYRIW